METPTRNGFAQRLLILAVVVLLIALIGTITYALFSNRGFLESKKAVNEAKELYDAALEEMAGKTEQARLSYTEAGERFSAAQQNANLAEEDYQNCLAAFEESRERYEQARQFLQSAEVLAGKAQTDFAAAQTAFTAAKTALTAAQAELTAARGELASAEQAYEDAEEAYTDASELLESAIDKYDEAAADYDSAVKLIQNFIESGGSGGAVPTANEIYAQSIDSIVEIRAYDVAGVWFKLGSGFFISQDGRIVTNYHVIQNSYRLEAYHTDGNFYPVTAVLGYDPDIDLAVIKIDKNDCAPLPLATKQPKVGDTVYAIGSNLGLTRTFTKGIVAYVDRPIEGFEANLYLHYVGITHSGNSGGPILNAYGEVVGIHQLGDAETGDNGLAIPVSQLEMIALTKNETPYQTMIDNAADISDYLTYSTVAPGKVKITGVTALIEDAVVKIPSMIDGYEVVSLDWGNNSVYIYYVEHIVVSEGIQTIGDEAFLNGVYLRAVTLPSTLKTLSETAFAQTSELYKIYLAAENTDFVLADDVLYNATQTVLYRYPLCKSDSENETSYTTSYSVPSGVTKICDYAMFYALGLEEVTLPSSLREIGTMGLSYCLNLETLNLPSGLQTLGIGALSANISLTSVTVPASVTMLGERLNDGSGYIYKGVFFQCEGLESVSFASGSQLTEIGDSAFGYCYELTSVTGLPAGLRTVGAGTFLYCWSLRSVDLFNTALQSIGSSAFRYCLDLTSVTLPKLLKEIPERAFYNCTSLNIVPLPAGVTAIGDNAFYGCTSLQSVSFSAGLASIGEGAFYGCQSLTEAALENTVLSSLGIYAFCATGLQNVALPATLGTVSDYAFSACPGLRSVTLSAGTRWIKTGAFSDCPALATIDATACEYPPHLTDADVFEGSSPNLVLSLMSLHQERYRNDSAWMVYRDCFRFV